MRNRSVIENIVLFGFYYVLTRVFFGEDLIHQTLSNTGRGNVNLPRDLTISDAITHLFQFCESKEELEMCKVLHKRIFVRHY